MKLSEWAKQSGFHYRTVWGWAKTGQLPVPAFQTPSGSWMVEVPDLEPALAGRVVAYCSVLSADKSEDLERQVGRVVVEAASKGLSLDEVVTEIGADAKGKRKRLIRILGDPNVATIVIEHPDRLTRSGFAYIAAALNAHGRSIVTLDAPGLENDHA